MARKKALNAATIIKNIARYTLSVLWILVFIYAFLSGNNDSAKSINDVLKISPYTVPWLILFGLIIIAWVWDFIGGIIITLFGIAIFYFFNFRNPVLMSTGSILAYLIVLLGSLLILSSYIAEDRN